MAAADRRELERARRKQEILQAARAVFAQDGYNRATVAAIARRADLGKGTLYLYFDTKEAILAELTLQALGELGEHLQAATDRCSPLHPDLRLRAMADAYLAFAQHAPDYFRLLNAFDHGGFQDGISSALKEQILIESNRTLDLVAQAVGDGIALGIFAHGGCPAGGQRPLGRAQRRAGPGRASDPADVGGGRCCESVSCDVGGVFEGVDVKT